MEEHTRLTDEDVGEIVEVYQPIQLISTSSEDFEERLQDAVFDLIYDGKLSEDVAKGLSAELAESMSEQYSEGLAYN